MKDAVVGDSERTEATRSTAGNRVKMAENAAPLATANASCSKARQNADRRCRAKRHIARKAATREVYTPKQQGATGIIAPWLVSLAAPIIRSDRRRCADRFTRPRVPQLRSRLRGGAVPARVRLLRTRP